MASTVARAARAFALACCVIPAYTLAQTQAAVEYYYADWDYYFETSFPNEISLLDNGAFAGVWKRTGQTFTVWPQAAAGSSATCRFFSTSFAPKSSHFYTPFDAECATVKNNPNWQFEAIAFYLKLPDASGACPPGTKILYRLYNNGMGGAPNHRYTTSPTVFAQMKAAGWIFEGNGLTGAFACVPQFDGQGYWVGATATGATLFDIVLDDASYYLLYTLPGNQTFNGFVHGTLSTASGQFNSSDARGFAPGIGVVPGTLAGSYVPKMSMSGSVTAALGNDTYTLTYQPGYEVPVSVAAVAGSYTGTLGALEAAQNTTLTIDGAGVLSTTFSSAVFGNCSFAGVVTPRGSVNVFELLIATQGNQCAFGGRIEHTGIVVYDAPSRRIVLLAPNPGRGDALIFVGTKQ